jgi:arylsulfatase A-like enzyme
VLVALIDDVGFGASSAFGGPVSMPTAERLAAGGLKYNWFHTTALCSPTRAALLSGRNHHAVGMGGITEIATSAPGYNSVRPNTCAPLAEILKLNGYSTAQFGKCHEVPVWQTSPLGPFDAWPSGGGGFEYFYGFIGGEALEEDRRLRPGSTFDLMDSNSDSGACSAEQLLDDLINVAARGREQLVPVALLGQALLPLPGRPAVVLQPCPVGGPPQVRACRRRWWLRLRGERRWAGPARRRPGSAS